MSEFKPMVLCGHANEAPPTCSCPPDCWCREFMCRLPEAPEDGPMTPEHLDKLKVWNRYGGLSRPECDDLLAAYEAQQQEIERLTASNGVEARLAALPDAQPLRVAMATRELGRVYEAVRAYLAALPPR